MCAWSNKILGNSFDKVGCWHEDGDGADDVEDTEGHETEAVDDSPCELPLLCYTVAFILGSEPIGNVTHLIQDSLQLWVSSATTGCWAWTTTNATRDSTGTSRGIQVWGWWRGWTAEMWGQVERWAGWPWSSDPTWYAVPWGWIDQQWRWGRLVQARKAGVKQVAIVVSTVTLWGQMVGMACCLQEALGVEWVESDRYMVVLVVVNCVGNAASMGAWRATAEVGSTRRTLRVFTLPRALHAQKPGHPLEQNQLDL